MAKETSLTLEESLALRREKLARLRKECAAYPNDFVRSSTLGEVRSLPEGSLVAVAGRLTGRRTAGKAVFANISDATGQMQLYAKQDSGQAFALLLDSDFGDIIGLEGELFITGTGELTVKAQSGKLISKCLLNFTPKVQPTEERERKRRYLALAARPELRERFIKRSQIVQKIRSHLLVKGFVEVETPMLHSVQGGAAAQPFVTHHMALDRDYFLRIAPELYLKRLLVGGFDKVFEINRSFRNEGMSEQHNPEFTMLECYAAYEDFNFMLEFNEQMLRMLAEIDWRGLGDRHVPGVIERDGVELKFKEPFARMTMAESLCKHNCWTEEQISDPAFLASEAGKYEGEKAAKASSMDAGALRCLLFEKTVEHKLIQPTFITEFPASMSPLARRSDADPSIAERFELYVGGSEIANAFSELNDPDVQAEVFKAQVAKANDGDLEAMAYDEDYITALSYAMPPATGNGVGIDRLAMLLLGCSSIRDVILFPQQRPEREAAG